MKLTLAVFLEEPRYDLARFHFLRLVLHYFQTWGHRARISVPGREMSGRIDAGLIHVDATVVPPAVLARVPPGLPLINGAVRDISKRSYSQLLVKRDDAWQGPVIVKSNANMGGARDAARARRSGSASAARPRARSYHIGESKARVAAAVWSDPEWVVERFVPEREGTDYLLRKWVFLGNSSVFLIDRSSKPIVKAGLSTQANVDVDVPEELAARRRQLGFDYGKFDYVKVDGKAVLLDANSTPGFARRNARIDGYAEVLARGLVEWIEAACSRTG